MTSINSQKMEVVQREKGLSTKLTVAPQILSKADKSILLMKLLDDACCSHFVRYMTQLILGPLKSTLVFKESETMIRLLGSPCQI